MIKDTALSKNLKMYFLKQNKIKLKLKNLKSEG